MQETINLLVGLARERGRLDAINEPVLHLHIFISSSFIYFRIKKTDLLGVSQLLHEHGVLLDTGDVERLRLRADRHDEVVVGHGGAP